MSKNHHQSEKLPVETLNEADPMGPCPAGLQDHTVFLLSKNKKIKKKKKTFKIMTVVFQENSNVSGYTEYQVKTRLPNPPSNAQPHSRSL